MDHSIDTAKKDTYSKEFIVSLMNSKVELKKISVLCTIPGTTVPHNFQKNILIDIQKYFNLVTTINVESTALALREVILEHLTGTSVDTTKKEAELIASKILDSFVINKSALNIYGQLVNSIHNIKISNENNRVITMEIFF